MGVRDCVYWFITTNMTEEAVLDWIKTFETVDGCSSISDLCSGHIVGSMLSEM